jgi:hypothetical protein
VVERDAQRAGRCRVRERMLMLTAIPPSLAPVDLLTAPPRRRSFIHVSAHKTARVLSVPSDRRVYPRADGGVRGVRQSRLRYSLSACAGLRQARPGQAVLHRGVDAEGVYNRFCGINPCSPSNPEQLPVDQTLNGSFWPQQSALSRPFSRRHQPVNRRPLTSVCCTLVTASLSSGAAGGTRGTLRACTVS